MRIQIPHLQRARLSAWATFLVRAFATAGLVVSAILAGGEENGLLSLTFLTVAAVVAIAVVRARRALRRVTAAVRFHRLLRESLVQLASAGWHLKHNVRWPEGPGDGHLAMTPGGELAFAIKDCVGPISDFDLSQTQDFATALGRTGRPYIPICVSAAKGARSISDRGVLCCTPERLAGELLDAEQAFAMSLRDEAAQNQLLYSGAE